MRGHEKSVSRNIIVLYCACGVRVCVLSHPQIYALRLRLVSFRCRFSCSAIVAVKTRQTASTMSLSGQDFNVYTNVRCTYAVRCCLEQRHM